MQQHLCNTSQRLGYVGYIISQAPRIRQWGYTSSYPEISHHKSSPKKERQAGKKTSNLSGILKLLNLQLKL